MRMSDYDPSVVGQIVAGVAFLSIYLVFGLILIEGLGVSGWKAPYVVGCMAFYGLAMPMITYRRAVEARELKKAFDRSNELIERLTGERVDV